MGVQKYDITYNNQQRLDVFSIKMINEGLW